MKAIYFFVLLSFFACHRKAVPVSAVEKADTVARKPAPGPPPSRRRHAPVSVNEIDFAYLNGKAKLSYSDFEKDNSLKVNVRLRKDSVIWLTFHVSAIQGGRMLINQDSMALINMIEHEYYIFTFKALTEKYHLPISYQLIQKALLGNRMFEEYAPDSVSEEAGQKIVWQRVKDLTVKTYISNVNNKILQADMQEQKTGNRLRIEYSNFQPLADKLYPFNIRLSIHYFDASNVWRDILLNLDFSKLEVANRELKFPFSIPRRYERK